MASNGDGGKRRDVRGWKPPMSAGDADAEKGAKEKRSSESGDAGASCGPRY